MILFEIAMIILAIGFLLYATFHFFWIISLILIYRTIGSIIPFTMLVEKFGFDNHLIYFIVVMSISIAIHFGIIVVTSDWKILRVVFYILMFIWVMFYYDVKELLLLSDWVESSGFEFSVEWIKEQLHTLVTTSPSEYLEMFVEFINKIAGGLESFFNAIFGSSKE